MIHIFVLSHQDDEIPVFKYIKDLIKSGKKVYIFYLTNGNILKKINTKHIIKREIESLSVLKKLGVQTNNVIFLGRKYKINSYMLHHKLKKIYFELSTFIRKLNGNITIYTHSWEGGNIDHDTSFIIVIKLINKFKKILNSFQFAFYNSYKLHSKFYRVFYPIPTNGLVKKKKITIKEKIDFIGYLFTYKTQIKVWIGLYPFIIYKILFNQFGLVQKINKKFFLARPHSNQLWYEKRKIQSFDKIKPIYENFLKLKK